MRAVAQWANSQPTPPPGSASSRLSVNSCPTIRRRPAPSARRMPISFTRAAARASSRFATLAQATSNTRPETHKASMAPRRSAFVPSVIRPSGSETICTFVSALFSGYCSASASAIRFKSASACARVTPGLSRPSALNLAQPRSVSQAPPVPRVADIISGTQNA